jgi:hypothetical protein
MNDKSPGGPPEDETAMANWTMGWCYSQFVGSDEGLQLEGSAAARPTLEGMAPTSMHDALVAWGEPSN